MVRPSSRRSSQEQVDDLRLDRHVERGDRLVADEQVGLHGERAGDGDALALAARELVRIARRRNRGRARPRSSQFADIGCGVAARRRRPWASGPSAIVSPMRMRGSSEANGSWNTVWTRVVRLRGARRRHHRLRRRARTSPAARRQDAGDDAAERRLAAAGFADEAEGLAAARSSSDTSIDRLHGARLDAAAEPRGDAVAER